MERKLTIRHPCMSKHLETAGKKKSLLAGSNFQQSPTWGGAAMCHERLGVWGAREVSQRLIITNTALDIAALRTPRNANKATTKQRPHPLWFKKFSAHFAGADQRYKENQFFSVRGFSMCIHTEESLSIENMFFNVLK